mmetsp:Transcript_19859/g.55222  ORF Transcript_19859/g.55222 Transcript_19859/m.55222 type:complete len:320 (-) Transcript_19859:57-1016(-)
MSCYCIFVASYNSTAAFTATVMATPIVIARTNEGTAITIATINTYSTQCSLLRLLVARLGRNLLRVLEVHPVLHEHDEIERQTEDEAHHDGEIARLLQRRGDADQGTDEVESRRDDGEVSRLLVAEGLEYLGPARVEEDGPHGRDEDGAVLVGHDEERDEAVDRERDDGQDLLLQADLAEVPCQRDDGDVLQEERAVLTVGREGMALEEAVEGAVGVDDYLSVEAVSRKARRGLGIEDVDHDGSLVEAGSQDDGDAQRLGDELREASRREERNRGEANLGIDLLGWVCTPDPLRERHHHRDCFQFDHRRVCSVSVCLCG